MNRSVSKRNFVGIFGVLISTVVITAIFVYLLAINGMNFGFQEIKITPNTHDLTNYSTKSDLPLNFDENTASILVAAWIGLMIVGSYLLFHIHFKVLPKE